MHCRSGQREQRSDYLNRNNFEMKGGTVAIGACTMVVTWYCPGQTGTLVTGKLCKEKLCLGGDCVDLDTGVWGGRGAGRRGRQASECCVGSLMAATTRCPTLGA